MRKLQKVAITAAAVGGLVTLGAGSVDAAGYGHSGHGRTRPVITMGSAEGTAPQAPQSARERRAALKKASKREQRRFVPVHRAHVLPQRALRAISLLDGLLEAPHQRKRVLEGTRQANPAGRTNQENRTSGTTAALGLFAPAIQQGNQATGTTGTTNQGNQAIGTGKTNQGNQAVGGGNTNQGNQAIGTGKTNQGNQAIGTTGTTNQGNQAIGTTGTTNQGNQAIGTTGTTNQGNQAIGTGKTNQGNQAIGSEKANQGNQAIGSGKTNQGNQAIGGGNTNQGNQANGPTVALGLFAPAIQQTNIAAVTQ
ncbi:hypothetical protein [Streptomyces mexicanus]|uniref:hypothetical protein n=1 Tax=Streptomyces mexicanus TaxID=178566 RepID=UPI00364C7F21